jgi:trk system potassium uptake protein TrkH
VEHDYEPKQAGWVMEVRTHRTLKSYVVNFLTPQRTLILGFAALICLGTALLTLPWASKTGTISLLDAIFTATSAVCVTGLIVVDTGGYFTTWGQGVILCLIQVGGLGIMTFSVFFYHLLGMDISLRDRMAVQDTLTYAPVRDIFHIVKMVLIYAAIFELIGMCLLFAGWLPYYPFGTALYLSLFHSVSAFCNAGFCLFEKSLIAYQGNPIINGTVISLITLGGIGFFVLHQLRRWVEHRSRLSLHTRLVVATSAFLIVVGTLLFFLFEQKNTLAGLPLKNSLLISLFQSVTARTAGFSTVNFWQLSDATLFIFVILMFIGASPGSCGGGIKTTNLAILFFIAWNRFLGKSDVNMLKRTLPKETVTQSITLLLTSLLVVTTILILLNISQGGIAPHPETRGLFLELLFETMSAFGTVGLSTGATATLTPSSKALITITMFVGRLGPLTLAYALARRAVESRFQYTEENIMVG